MSEPDRPTQRPFNPGAVPPGAPTTLWTPRAQHLGEGHYRIGILDRIAGLLFLLAWRMAGWLAWPILLLHPGARRHMLNVPAPEPGWTWLHGASAGEQVAARALTRAVDDCWRTSSSWRTPIPDAFPAPLDLPVLVGRWLDRARPGRLVLVEGELWPGWLMACRERGIPITVVNARPGKGMARWRVIGPLWRWLTEDVEFIDQAQTGDLKLSTVLREATVDLGRDAFIGASTRPGDEVRLLNAWSRLNEPRPMLVLAPRHLSRLPEVEALLDASGFAWQRRTEGFDPHIDVLLLDTIGELASLYSQAKAAFIGGTFDPDVGGHSPAEAMAAGLPVVHGPQTASNAIAFESGIAIRVPRDEDLLAGIRAALSMGPGALPENEAVLRCAALLPQPILPKATPARPWLWPLAGLWRILSRCQMKPPSSTTLADAPVVMVGGLAAGGAGRTPTVAWLAQALDGAWVVSRGYRRNRDGPPLRIGHPDTPPVHDLGDELEMLRRRGIPVVSCPDRAAGIQAALDQGAAVVLVDGGLDNPSIPRRFTIACVDAQWPLSRGAIPIGWARTPWGRLATADAIWVHHVRMPIEVPKLPEGPLVISSHTEPIAWRTPKGIQPIESITDKVDVVVGIARPERFVCTLLRMGLSIHSLRMVRDHGNLGSLSAGTVVTEKDAARLPPDADIRALCVDPVPVGGSALLDAIRASL